ncbi:MAG: hypothetical protein QF743_00745 [Candidatus Marinimicrobia bacterium]|nr:hypothetical protein [Candidatus Neomarinimicrobiota bacterium]
MWLCAASYHRHYGWAKQRETHPDGLRRPLWMAYPLTPKKEQFYIK